MEFLKTEPRSCHLALIIGKLNNNELNILAICDNHMDWRVWP